MRTTSWRKCPGAAERLNRPVQKSSRGAGRAGAQKEKATRRRGPHLDSRSIRLLASPSPRLPVNPLYPSIPLCRGTRRVALRYRRAMSLRLLLLAASTLLASCSAPPSPPAVSAAHEAPASPIWTGNRRELGLRAVRSQRRAELPSIGARDARRRDAANRDAEPGCEPDTEDAHLETAARRGSTRFERSWTPASSTGMKSGFPCSRPTPDASITIALKIDGKDLSQDVTPLRSRVRRGAESAAALSERSRALSDLSIERYRAAPKPAGLCAASSSMSRTRATVAA